MKTLALAFMLVAGGALAVGSVTFTPDQASAAPTNKKIGGGPGNSGPGDKNSRNERGHGGQP